MSKSARPGGEGSDNTPDRFAEGFSILIASSVLLGLWKSGDLSLPRVIARGVPSILLTGIIVGIIWAGMGLRDRYAEPPTEPTE